MKTLILILSISTILNAQLIRDASSEIVTDKVTNLQWQDNTASAKLTWSQAIDYCQELSLDSDNGVWRLPNIRELYSLIDYNKNHPFVFRHESRYWSSTSSPKTKKIRLLNFKLYINFKDGAKDASNQGTKKYAMCVR